MKYLLLFPVASTPSLFRPCFWSWPREPSSQLNTWVWPGERHGPTPLPPSIFRRQEAKLWRPLYPLGNKFEEPQPKPREILAGGTYPFLSILAVRRDLSGGSSRSATPIWPSPRGPTHADPQAQRVIRDPHLVQNAAQKSPKSMWRPPAQKSPRRSRRFPLPQGKGGFATYGNHAHRLLLPPL